MAMMIWHAQFHRITPLDANPDSKKILQTLSEQCEDYDQRVESLIEVEGINSE